VGDRQMEAIELTGVSVHGGDEITVSERQLLKFTALILLCAIVLQRIGPQIGTSYLSVVGPLGLLLAGYGLTQGYLGLDRIRLMLFIALVAWMILGGALRAAFPETLGTAPSWTSLFQFIMLSSFGTLAFARPISERNFFSLVTFILMMLGLAGILQFALQFAGLSLFSFSGFVPARYLLEGPYNTVIPIGTSNYLKSNGLFLVEPSVFSQFMALGIIIEMIMFRRLVYVVVFSSGLMASISGTGWIMILSFILSAAFSLGIRGVFISLITVAAGAATLVGLYLIFPAGFDFFMSRTSEIYAIGSSGHDRFVTPWWLAGFVLDRAPWTALYGLGAGVSEHLAMQPPWVYNINPPVKIGLEYGLPCFIIYFMFLLAGRRTSTQKALLVPVLVLLLLDGGYQQFPPVLFPAMLLIMVASLKPSRP
jgi:hypothetical protein